MLVTRFFRNPRYNLVTSCFGEDCGKLPHRECVHVAKEFLFDFVFADYFAGGKVDKNGKIG